MFDWLRRFFHAREQPGRFTAELRPPFRSRRTLWQGHIRQGEECFAASVVIWERGEERVEGEIRFTSPMGESQLTFEGRVVDRNTIVWITDKKDGPVTYPGLYVGRIDGDHISGTWQVPSANQYDRFALERATARGHAGPGAAADGPRL